MRAQLPFGIVWSVLGVLYLVLVVTSGDVDPNSLVSPVISIVGGLILAAGGWAYRREQR